MSSRLKERGGGGGKVMASRPHKALPLSTPKEKVAATGRRTPVAAGKENPRTLSGGKVSGAGAARPNRGPKLVEKPAGPAAAVRWSTSSMPRGKAPNPSDVSKLLSDLRGDRRMPRVSGSSDRTGRVIAKDLEAEAGAIRRSFGGIRGVEKFQQGKGPLESNSKEKDPTWANRKPDGRLGMQPAKTDSRDSVRSSDANLGKNSGKAANLTSGSEIRSGKDQPDPKLGSSGRNETGDVCIPEDKKDGTFLLASDLNENGGNRTAAVDIAKDKPTLATSLAPADGKALDGARDSNDLKSSSCLASHVEASERGTDNSIIVRDDHGVIGCAGLDGKRDVEEKPFGNIRVFEKLREDDKAVQTINKYPSKLHEKLALLEGKVQKIASEIKRTKEMLDLNNTDESKLILSDIQSKISGIEKAVGHVAGGTKGQLGSSETIKFDSLQNKNAAIGQPAQMPDSKHLAKRLNHEELEVRFFPHHKLLRNRKPSCDSAGPASTLWKHESGPDKDGVLTVPIDENPIAMEFLASLKEQAEVEAHGKMVQSDDAGVRKMGLKRNPSVGECSSKKVVGGHHKEDTELLSTEKLEEFDDQENKPVMTVHEETEEACTDQLCEIGHKPSTGGWFVSEGEAVLLAHDDGSCSYYDIANSEIKTEYKPPAGVSNNLWGDCWLIRAPGADGCSGRYVVAASAGNTLDSGFCSWDFYNRDIKAFRVEEESHGSSSVSLSSRKVLDPLPNTGSYRRSVSGAMPTVEGKQWWYRPCGPLLVSTATRQKAVSAYDIRDGDVVMKWEAKSPIMNMEYSSPLQWRSRGKLIIAETEDISLWDVNSLNPQPLLSVATIGKRVYSLHVNNPDAEVGGGVRQRVSSSEVEGNDGVYCTPESINVFDFRLPTGVGLKLSRHGAIGHSIFSRGDSIYVGSTEGRLPMKGGPRSWVQEFSLRKAKLVCTYEMPEFNSHFHHSSVTQVWGNSNLVMGICGMGLFVFDALRDEGPQTFGVNRGNTVEVKETIGPDDLYRPTFDYLGSRVLVISRDRPAFWRYLL